MFRKTSLARLRGRRDYFFYVLFLALPAIILREMLQGGIINFGDINWIVSANTTNWPFFAWYRQPLLGNNVFSLYAQLSQLPFQVGIWASLSLLGPEVSQFVFFAATLAVCGFSCYFFALRYVGDNKLVATLASLVYLFSPFTVYRFPASPFLFLQFATFPLLILFFDRATTPHSSLKELVLAALMVGLSADLLLSGFPVIILSLLLMVAVKTLRGPSRLFPALRSVATFALAIALDSFWIIPWIWNYVGDGTAGFRIGSSSELVSLSSSSTLLNVVRLQGYWWSSVQPLIPKENELFPLLNASTYILPAVALCSYILLFRRNRMHEFMLINGLVFLYLSLGLNSPLPWLYENLVNVSFLRGLRDPFKFALPVILSFSYGFGIFCDAIMRKTAFWRLGRVLELFRNRGLLRQGPRPLVRISIVISLTLLVVSTNGYPLLFNDAMGSLQTVSYPASMNGVNAFLSGDSGQFRVLWLPLRTGALFSWSPSAYYWMTDPAIVSSSKPSLGYSFIETSAKGGTLDFVRYVYSVLATGRTTHFGHMLALTGTKYVVFRPDVLPIESIDFVPLPKLLELLRSQEDLSFVHESGGYLVFRNNAWLDVIQTGNSPISVFGDLSTFSAMTSGALTNRTDLLYFFLSQQDDKVRALAGWPLLLYNRDVQDLIMEVAKGNYSVKISPSQDSGWKIISNPFDSNPLFKNDISLGTNTNGYLVSNGRATMSTTVSFREPGAYQIWVQALASKGGGRLSFAWNGALKAEVNLETSGGSALRWFYLWPEMITPGVDQLTITGDKGPTLISDVLVIPDETLQRVKDKIFTEISRQTSFMQVSDGNYIAGINPDANIKHMAGTSQGLIAGQVPQLTSADLKSDEGWQFNKDANVQLNGSLIVNQLKTTNVTNTVYRTIDTLPQYGVSFGFRMIRAPSAGHYTILLVSMYQGNWNWWITLFTDSVQLGYIASDGSVKSIELGKYVAGVDYSISAVSNQSLYIAFGNNMITVGDRKVQPIDSISLAQVTGAAGKPFVDGKFEVNKILVYGIGKTRMGINLFAPSTGDYALFVRYGLSNSSIIQLDQQPPMPLTDTSGTSLSTMRVDVHLIAGVHSLQISTNATIGIDTVSIISMSLLNSDANPFRDARQSSDSVNYVVENPTSWSVRNSGSGASIVFFAETYSKWWQLTYKGGTVSSLQGNYFGNAFILSQPATEFTLTFSLQNVVASGMLISVASLTVALGLVTASRIRTLVAIVRRKLFALPLL